MANETVEMSVQMTGGTLGQPNGTIVKMGFQLVDSSTPADCTIKVVYDDNMTSLMTELANKITDLTNKYTELQKMYQELQMKSIKILSKEKYREIVDSNNFGKLTKYAKIDSQMLVEEGISQIPAHLWSHIIDNCINLELLIDDVFGLGYNFKLESKINIISQLIEKGITIDAPIKCGNRAIHYICHDFPNKELVNLLIKKKANLDIINDDKESALHLLCQNYEANKETDVLDVMNLLLQCSTSMNNLNANGDTPLHISAKTNQMELVRILLLFGANPDVRNKEGRRPVWYACENGNMEMAQLLA
jgi:ankyrin repeat protein